LIRAATVVALLSVPAAVLYLHRDAGWSNDGPPAEATPAATAAAATAARIVLFTGAA